jgi:hypothetical protein
MGSWEFSATLESLELDCKGQNTSHWGFLYIIEKILKCRCSKWARMTHLDLCDKLWPKERQGINLIPLRVGDVQHDIGKVLRRDTTLVQTSSRSEVCTKSYSPAKLRTLSLGDFETPIWESRDKKPFRCHSHEVVQSILYGGRWWLPPSSGHG